MPLIARIIATLLAVAGLASLVAAIWLDEEWWKLSLTAFVLFLAALVIVAATHPTAGKRK